MSAIVNFFSGKKTYIIGLLLIIAGFLNDKNVEMIIAGLGFITGRQAIAKLEQKL